MRANFRKIFERVSRGCAIVLASAALLGLAHAAAAEDAASAWVRNEHAALRLIAAAIATGNADTVQVGLQFELRPGWKTYWRSPGDAGFPPHGDWSRSTNVADVSMAWPAPERFEVLGFETFGYERQVVLPLTVRIAQPGQPVVVRGSVDYLVCERICVPYTAELSLQLPAGPPAPSAFAHLINRWASQVPSPGAGLTVESASLRLDPPALAVRVASTLPVVRLDAIVEGPEGWSFTRPRVEVAPDRLSATLVLPAQGSAGMDARQLVGRALTITAVDEGRAAEGRVSVAAPGTEADASLLAMLGLALLGGLILNLMPCVLPVLSLKLLGVVGQAGAARARVRLGFLASAAGIFAAFAVLAGGLIALRAAGQTIGWGIQFQQPLFLTFMALVVTLFAANLWGWFELGLPGSMADRLDQGAAAAERRGSLAGSFVTGAFATVLATPCSAPFLGTAVGFALARGPVEIAAIFATLALGLALPYLALAALPGIAARLPRPGRWMAVLRMVLGLAMAGTALWLLVILRAQIGEASTAAVAVVLAALLAGLFALRHARRMVRAAAIALAAGFAFVPLGIGAAPVAPSAVAGPWQVFERERIGALVREGRAVFVDVTAEWCLICQVNKAAVLNRGAVAARLAAPEVVAMRADWTRPDPRVSAYLASFGRYGIPFNAIYGPGAPDGIALPEILTEDAVLQALARAQAAPAAAAR